LEKPFVLLKKVRVKIPLKSGVSKSKENESDEDEDEDDSDEDKSLERRKETETKSGGNSEEDFLLRTEYLVQAVIRRKLLFNKRPRPIVCHQTRK
jgi:hypothetical protein